LHATELSECADSWPESIGAKLKPLHYVGLTPAQNGIAAEVEFNGYKVLYEPELPASGFSLASFGERAFAIGQAGMSSDLELARTVAQEVYRVNMTQIPELGIDATRAASETQAAFDFAQKYGDTIANGGG